MNNNRGEGYFEPINDNLPIGDLVPSKSEYLGKGDIPADMNGVDLTIRGFRRENIKGDNGVFELKTVCYWAEPGFKKFILNKVNSDLLGLVTGAQTAGQMKGKKVNIYFDPTVSFGGKLVGGIRLRGPQGIAPAPQATPAMTGPNAMGSGQIAAQPGLQQLRNQAPSRGLDDLDSDIPF